MAPDPPAPGPLVLMLSRGPAGERNESRIEAMVWSQGTDPHLVVAESFRTEAELRAWLGTMVLRGLHFAVAWTDQLKADAELRRVLDDMLR